MDSNEAKQARELMFRGLTIEQRAELVNNIIRMLQEGTVLQLPDPVYFTFTRRAAQEKGIFEWFDLHGLEIPAFRPALGYFRHKFDDPKLAMLFKLAFV